MTLTDSTALSFNEIREVSVLTSGCGTLFVPLFICLATLAEASHPYANASDTLTSPIEVPNPSLQPQVRTLPSSTETPSLPDWNPEGQEFSVYGLAKDALIATLSRATSDVVVVSPQLTDGDVATALLAARLRGVRVRVLLDSHGAGAYLSRHGYLAENKVETSLKTLKGMGGWSTLVIDGQAWELSSALDDRVKGGVRIVPSPREPAVVAGWFETGRPVVAAQGGRFGFGAKVPTRRAPAPGPSATIEESKTVVRRSGRSRGLPRETRAQLLESGKLRQESGARSTRDSGESLSRKPDVSSREAELP